MLKGLIFDLDGVITDTAEYHYLAWKKLAQELDIQIDRAFNENLKGISRLESLELILKYGGQESQFTEQEKNELATKKNDHYKMLIENITPRDLLPGMKQLLEESKDTGIKMVIASASKNAPAILNKLEVEKYFTGIVNPAELKYGKPHPEIFIKATKLLELENNEVVGIEDAISGIQAINRADIFSVGVGDKEALKEADLVVSDTKDLTLDLIISHFNSIDTK